MRLNTTIKTFFDRWQKQDYKGMYELTQLTWKSRNTAENVENLFGGIKLKSYVITAIEAKDGQPRAKVIAELKLTVDKRFRDPDAFREVEFNVICESEPYNPTIKGEWGVNPISVWKVAK